MPLNWPLCAQKRVLAKEIDVCIVGAGVSGLSAAVALLRVDPRLSVKVLDSRQKPTSKYGGFLSLQPNGRKAAAAISPDLAKALDRNALLEKRTLLHGEDGRLITRLDMPMELAPSQDIVQANDEDIRKRGQAAAKCRKELNACTQDTLIMGWWELERLLVGMLPEHTVEYEASFLKYSETEGGAVAIFEGLAYPIRCRALLGCDGPFSGVRAQCVQDSEPAYDRTVKYNGRLDGHHVSTTPLDFCSWWIKKGQVFISHPLANGDVGWEALVSERELQAAGFKFDESLSRVLPENYERGDGTDIQPAETLAALFKGYPRSVDQMIRYAPPDAILESGVYIRSPAEMPPSMGKGRVAILGEAAHPLR